MTMTLNSLSGGLSDKLLISVPLRFPPLPGFYLLLFGMCSSVSSFRLTFCVCFCELEQLHTSPSLEGVALSGSFLPVDWCAWQLWLVAAGAGMGQEYAALWGYLNRTAGTGVGTFSGQAQFVWARDLGLA